MLDEPCSVLDEFISELVPTSLRENDDQLHRFGGNLVIPRKVITAIIHEIAFDE